MIIRKGNIYKEIPDYKFEYWKNKGYEEVETKKKKEGDSNGKKNNSSK